MTDKPHWTAGVHHDGSEMYVSNPLPKFGETVTIKIRVPVDAPVTAVYLRHEPDGEGKLITMQQVESDDLFTYWQVDYEIIMPLVRYRFRIMTDVGAYFLNGLGISQVEGPDLFDFKLVADLVVPSWLEDRVFYQIFPDRFYNGDPSLDHEPGEWTRDGYDVQIREWGEPPLPFKEGGNVDFYGGDLWGIQQKIDYFHDLGVNALYLCPIFSSLSNHRYDIHDFYTVDKHLGGNQALVDLTIALYEADIRLILDVTPNHTSSSHPWFMDSQHHEDAAFAEYYTFYERPDDYEAWFGVKTLPKLNYGSPKLRDHMYGAEDSVLQYWLDSPYNVDGWRLDVYNMTARQGRLQVLEEVGREMRQAIKSKYPETYIFGENFYDATPYLQGDQLDAVMNYQGFNIPMWRWLTKLSSEDVHHDAYIDPHPLPSEVFTEQIARYRAPIPWALACIQFNQLGSHDTTRILTLVKHNKALVRLGVTMLMTYPGVPCVYYGDEIGLPGGHDPDNRRCMLWDEADWDNDLREYYKRVIDLRKTQPALLRGGYQDVYAEDGLWVFQRQSKAQQLVIIGYRDAEPALNVEIPVRHAGVTDGATLKDLLSRKRLTAKDGCIKLPSLHQGDVFIFEVS